MAKCEWCGKPVSFLTSVCNDCVTKGTKKRSSSQRIDNDKPQASEQQKNEGIELSDEAVEEVFNWMTKEGQRAIRLGQHYDIDGVDPEFVPVLAKITRIAGIIAVLLFVYWGWAGYRSPFEEFFDNLGASRSEREVLSSALSVVILILGFYYRFMIGSVVTASCYGIVRLFKRLVRAV